LNEAADSRAATPFPMENENTTTPPATTADAASAGSARPDPRAERAEAARRKRNTRGAFGKPKGARKEAGK